MNNKRHSFANLDPETRKAIAAKGGRIAHERGVAPEFFEGDERARIAGREGGRAVARKGREYMQMIGRAGGEAYARKVAERKAVTVAERPLPAFLRDDGKGGRE